MGFTILILDYGMRPGDVSRDSPLELQWSKLIHDFFTLRNQWILGALNDLRQEHWSTEDETMDVEPRRVSHMDSILFRISVHTCIFGVVPLWKEQWQMKFFFD